VPTDSSSWRYRLARIGSLAVLTGCAILLLAWAASFGRSYCIAAAVVLAVGAAIAMFWGTRASAWRWSRRSYWMMIGSAIAGAAVISALPDRLTVVFLAALLGGIGSVFVAPGWFRARRARMTDTTNDATVG